MLVYCSSSCSCVAGQYWTLRGCPCATSLLTLFPLFSPFFSPFPAVRCSHRIAVLYGKLHPLWLQAASGCRCQWCLLVPHAMDLQPLLSVRPPGWGFFCWQSCQLSIYIYISKIILVGTRKRVCFSKIAVALLLIK